MNKNKYTLSVYGIQDRFGYPYPLFIHDHPTALFLHGALMKHSQCKRAAGTLLF